MLRVVQQGMKQNGDKSEDTEMYQMCPVSRVNSVDIEFSDLTMVASWGFRSKKKKTILKSISGLFRSGELTAIMGPSGAGKSSLMNSLIGFSTEGVTGKIRAGNNTCNLGSRQDELRFLREYRKKSCYILQDDRLNPLFTVSELMKFAADLKLGGNISEKVKRGVINDVLDTLGLSGTENTRCANLSGGQSKRLSIAVELIDNPPVVFLDEPTTGLDSLSSTQCIQLLKKLANSGRTIVCTIHQPSASIYAMFDQVYVVADGMCVYSGSSENTVPYLESVGLQCPIYHNPADYILEVANCEYGDFNELLSKANKRHDWRKQAAQVIALDPKVDDSSTITDVKPPGELYKFRVLFKRSMVQLYRDWTVTHLKVLLHLLIGVLLGLLFVDAGKDASKTVTNIGYLLVCTVYLGYTSMMPAVLRFPQELPVIKKENFNNWYNLRTYYVAALITGIPMQIWFSFVYSLPSYFLSGQPQEMMRFFMFVFTLSCNTVLADALGNVVGTSWDPINGTFVSAIYISAATAFAGFLVLISHMNKYLRPFSYISFLRFTLEGLILSLYGNDREAMACPEEVTYCHFRYPEKVIELFGYKPDNYWNTIGIMLGQVAIFRVLGYWTLRRKVRGST